MIGYKTRLEQDLKRWQESGWVDPESAKAIRADVAARTKHFGLAPVLAIFGAVLLCFAAMSFVAANWQDMSKLARLVILFVAMWGAYAAAWVLNRRQMPFFSQAAILLGVGLFGANIMLIAQMYHFDGNPPDAVLLWAGGALLAGVALRSRPALGLTVMLFALWSWWEVTQIDDVHWPFLIAWTIAAASIGWVGWRGGYHFLAITMTVWIIGLGFLLDHWNLLATRAAHPLVAGLGLVIATLAIIGREPIERLTHFSKPIVIYGLLVSFAGFFALQFIEKPSIAGLLLLAVLTLVLVIGALYYGWESGNRALTAFAYLGFSAELLGLYFKTLGTLLDTALFFFIAGLIVIALSWLAWTLNKRQRAYMEASS